jgi:hypothetical protein
MTATSDLSAPSHVHPIVLRQERYNLRRRLLRDFLLRPVGFGLLVSRMSRRERIPNRTDPVDHEPRRGR